MHVWVFRDGELTLVHSFPWSPAGERGIAALVVDPHYSTAPAVWLHYSHHAGSTVRNRVTRFSVTGQQFSAELVAHEGPARLNSEHNGGCLAFAPDGTLYIGEGDDVQGDLAQDPFDLRGKILRIHVDGTPVADNPFIGGGGDPRVFALGMRNPFRCSIEPVSGQLYVADVGAGTAEEVNAVIRGKNYGWPLTEGSQFVTLPGYVYPIHEYPNPGNAAIIGGAHARVGDLHPAYTGNYFYADLVNGNVYRWVPSPDLLPVAAERWATGSPRIVDLKFGPEGALYYLQRDFAVLRRVVFVGAANLPPQAVGVAARDSGLAPLVVTLDGAASSDPDLDSLDHHWTFGDGGSGSGAVVTHTYAAGVYEAVLEVDDGHGLTDLSPPVRIVSGNRRPSVTITSPSPGFHYTAGQSVGFSATAADPEDGALGCFAFGWQVVAHFPGGSRVVSGPEKASCAASFVPLVSELPPTTDVFYRVHLSARDSGAPLGVAGRLIGRAAVEIHPVTSNLELTTAPLPNLAVRLDGELLAAPVSSPSVVGFERGVGAVDAQRIGAHTYTWLSWSDGGALEHVVAAPAEGLSLEATFGCDVIEEVSHLRVRRDGATLELSWSAVSDACLDASVGYRVYSAPTARPTSGAGTFPVDPPFTLVGTTTASSLTHDPLAGDEYFLVVAVGTDQLDGAIGHYTR